MHHLKQKKFVVMCICIGFFILTSLGFTDRAFTSAPSDEEIIIKTFNYSGAEFQSLTVRGWTLIEYKDYSGDPPALLKKRAANLFPAGFTSTISNSDDGLTTLRIRGRTAKDVTASLTLARQTGSITQDKEAYLILSLESSNPGSYRLMKNMYNKILKDETNKSIVIYGYINKKLSLVETNRVVENMIESTKLQNVETMAEQALVSVSGYSPNVRNVLTLDGKWVNINMALRYNSLNKRTMIYVGSPVITIEY